jgi:hypothetical protein
MDTIPSSEASGPPRTARDTAQKTALLVQEILCPAKDSNQVPPGCKSAAGPPGAASLGAAARSLFIKCALGEPLQILRK